MYFSIPNVSKPERVPESFLIARVVMFSLVFLQEKVDEVHARITSFKELERFRFCKYVLLGKCPD